eukprot:scaffold35670_cov56-Phaeocystis_antarctica.AAC.5
MLRAPPTAPPARRPRAVPAPAPPVHRSRGHNRFRASSRAVRLARGASPVAVEARVEGVGARAVEARAKARVAVGKVWRGGEAAHLLPAVAVLRPGLEQRAAHLAARASRRHQRGTLSTLLGHRVTLVGRRCQVGRRDASVVPPRALSHRPAQRYRTAHLLVCRGPLVGHLLPRRSHLVQPGHGARTCVRALEQRHQPRPGDSLGPVGHEERLAQLHHEGRLRRQRLARVTRPRECLQLGQCRRERRRGDALVRPLARTLGRAARGQRRAHCLLSESPHLTHLLKCRLDLAALGARDPSAGRARLQQLHHRAPPHADAPLASQQRLTQRDHEGSLRRQHLARIAHARERLQLGQHRLERRRGDV